MRGPIALFALLLLTETLAGPGLTQGTVGSSLDPTGRTGPADVRTGTVTYVDPATMNFVCQDKSTSQRYWATRATRFASGRSNGSFFDLAPGQSVQVTSHLSGRIEVADEVILLPRP
jgi:hypothetical protein